MYIYFLDIFCLSVILGTPATKSFPNAADGGEKCPKRVVLVEQGSLYSQPKQCTIAREIPENHHTSWWFQPISEILVKLNHIPK